MQDHGERATASSVAADGRPKHTGPRTGCTHHCVACGGHFTSQAAFDAHRRGKTVLRGPSERYCETDAADEHGPLLVVKTERGSCALAVPPVEGSAVVYSGRDWWKAAQSFRGRAA